jgi:NADPH:quinone reductase-like Zn-dependent oxidoreductase
MHKPPRRMLVREETTMKAIVFDRIGTPLEVLERPDVPAATSGDVDAVVDLSARSINSGDLHLVQGALSA